MLHHFITDSPNDLWQTVLILDTILAFKVIEWNYIVLGDQPESASLQFFIAFSTLINM
jgi:hypothetical protein